MNSRIVLWIIVTTLSSAVGFTLAEVFARWAGPFYGYFLGGFLFGITLGFGQWVSSRSWLPKIWILTKGTASAFGFWAGSYFFLIGAYVFGVTGATLGFGISLGLTIGATEFLVFKNDRPYAVRWAMASFLGILLGCAVGVALLYPFNLDFTSMTGFALIGASIGLLSGSMTSLFAKHSL
jgi:hypothetical protein